VEGFDPGIKEVIRPSVITCSWSYRPYISVAVTTKWIEVVNNLVAEGDVVVPPVIDTDPPVSIRVAVVDHDTVSAELVSDKDKDTVPVVVTEVSVRLPMIGKGLDTVTFRLKTEDPLALVAVHMIVYTPGPSGVRVVDELVGAAGAAEDV
jgi:hypothetical protein